MRNKVLSNGAVPLSGVPAEMPDAGPVSPHEIVSLTMTTRYESIGSDHRCPA